MSQRVSLRPSYEGTSYEAIDPCSYGTRMVSIHVLVLHVRACMHADLKAIDRVHLHLVQL